MTLFLTDAIYRARRKNKRLCDCTPHPVSQDLMRSIMAETRNALFPSIPARTCIDPDWLITHLYRDAMIGVQRGSQIEVVTPISSLVLGRQLLDHSCRVPILVLGQATDEMIGALVAMDELVAPYMHRTRTPSTAWRTAQAIRPPGIPTSKRALAELFCVDPRNIK